MKKLFLLCVGFLSIATIYGQDYTDALRYSNDNIKGTARYRALSGAFGALGGNMSAISINPAGSAIFNTSHISLSLSGSGEKNDVQYYNGFESDSYVTLDINQVGAAFVFNSRNPEAKWKRFTIGVAYDKIDDYDDEWFAQGTNTNSNPGLSNSIASYFLHYGQGLRLDEISAFAGESYADAYAEIGSAYGYGNQQAFLGYESFILEPDADTDDNTLYTSNIAPGNFYHEYSYVSTGYNGKFTVNGATQYNDKLYLGINLNSHFINYNRNTYLFENNDNAGSTVSQVGFENNLSTVGSGFSFQLGGILKITKDFRIGITYNSPTWLTLEEESTQNIATTREDAGSNINQFIDPQIINIFPQYKLQTPGKLTGSLAYLFGKRGLISFDYSVKDYSNAKFRPTSDSYFVSQNSIINNRLTSAATYRIGGELKHKRLSFRGGYRFEESPYKDSKTVGDLTGYSLGLGFNIGKMKLDVTYDYAERNNETSFYNVGFTDTASIDHKNSTITTSLSFNL